MKEEDYSIQYQLQSDWLFGFNGMMTIKNNTEKTIEDWILEFDYSRNITSIWNGTIVSHEGEHYIIKNAGYNSDITAKQAISFGFIGEGGNKENQPTNISLSSWCIGNDYTNDDTNDNTNDDNNDTNTNDDTVYNHDGIAITINTEQLIKNEEFDYYNVTDQTQGLSGTLTDANSVKSMSYEVKDLNDLVVETGDIKVSDIWSASNMKFTIGANNIVITATTKSGKKVQSSIVIFNDRMNNLSDHIDMKDSDGDKIPNYIEQYFNIKTNSTDSDEDTLSDYDEFFVLGTSPTKKDSDENGIPDAKEDIDKDGLISTEELEYHTNPFRSDSDNDGLSDGDEVHKYNTDPMKKDTDGDGVNDGKEIELGTNPFVVEDTFQVSATAEDIDTVKVSVDTSLSGEQVESLEVNRIKDDFLFPETMPGYISGAYDFSVNGMFSTATLTFEFNESLLNDASFDPVIYYYNEDTQLLEALDTTVTGNIATATVTHFSTYILVNRTVYEKSFEWVDVWNTKEYKNIEVILVIDDSGSMLTNDPTDQRLTAAKELIDNLDNLPYDSKVGIMRFTDRVDRLTPDTTFRFAKAKEYLTPEYFHSNGGTSMYKAIGSAIRMFASTNDTTARVLIVLSDGYTNDTDLHDSTIATANSKSVKIYTVGLGESTEYFSKYLQPLASQTGATFYYASNANQLSSIFNDISMRIDIETDSDNDGISDYYEDNLVMFNGVKIRTDKNDPDTDHDGLLDGEEVAKLTYEYNSTRTQVVVRGKLLSNPLVQDSDRDGILDVDDPEPFKHFGTYINNKIHFKLSNTNNIPYCSAIETAKAVTQADYQRIYNERKPSWINDEKEDALYILDIKTRVALMISAALGANYDLNVLSALSTIQMDINVGCYFLIYYMSNLGQYQEYDGTFAATGDANGKAKYQQLVGNLLRVCESGTKAGHTLKFTPIDASTSETDMHYCFDSLTTLNYGLAVKGCFIGMAGTCNYDGTYYSLDLHYCIQDYYDFFYEDPAGGLNSVGPVRNDEMAFLVLYDEATPFETCGIYHVNIKWKKGQTLSSATQTAY